MPVVIPDPSDQGILVGKMGRPFGVRGFGRVSVLSDNPDRFLDDRGETFHLATPSRVNGKSRRLVLEDTEWKGDVLLVKWEGIDSPEVLKEISGWDIFWEGPDDWIPDDSEAQKISDLIGMRVLDSLTGTDVGYISGFYERPGQDLLAIDAKGREILCPYVEPLVPRIDRDRREVYVQWGIVGI